MKEIFPNIEMLPEEEFLQRAFVLIQKHKLYSRLTVEDIRLPLCVVQEGIRYATRHFDTVAHFNK